MALRFSAFVVKHHFTVRHQGQPTQPAPPPPFPPLCFCCGDCSFCERAPFVRIWVQFDRIPPALMSRQHPEELPSDLTTNAFYTKHRGSCAMEPHTAVWLGVDVEANEAGVVHLLSLYKKMFIWGRGATSNWHSRQKWTTNLFAIGFICWLIVGYVTACVFYTVELNVLSFLQRWQQKVLSSEPSLFLPVCDSWVEWPEAQVNQT